MNFLLYPVHDVVHAAGGEGADRHDDHSEADKNFGKRTALGARLSCRRRLRRSAGMSAEEAFAGLERSLVPGLPLPADWLRICCKKALRSTALRICYRTWRPGFALADTAGGGTGGWRAEAWGRRLEVTGSAGEGWEIETAVSRLGCRRLGHRRLSRGGLRLRTCRQPAIGSALHAKYSAEWCSTFIAKFGHSPIPPLTQCGFFCEKKPGEPDARRTTGRSRFY